MVVSSFPLGRSQRPLWAIVLTSSIVPDQAKAASATTPKMLRMLKSRLPAGVRSDGVGLVARRQKAGKFKVIPRRLTTRKGVRMMPRPADDPSAKPQITSRPWPNHARWMRRFGNPAASPVSQFALDLTSMPHVAAERDYGE